MTYKILKRTAIQSSQNYNKAFETTHPTLTDKCMNYIKSRNKILGNTYRPNNDMIDILRLEIEELKRKLATVTQKLHASGKMNDSIEKLEYIHAISNNNRSGLTNISKVNNITSVKVDMTQQKRKHFDKSYDEELDYQEDNDQEEEYVVTKTKRGKMSDIDQMKQEIKLLELELKNTKDENRIMEIEQKILSDKKIIEAINVCTEYKEGKKQKKKNQIEFISTRSQTKNSTNLENINNTTETETNNKNNKNNIKLNGQKNSQDQLLQKQEEHLKVRGGQVHRAVATGRG